MQDDLKDVTFICFSSGSKIIDSFGLNLVLRIHKMENLQPLNNPIKVYKTTLEKYKPAINSPDKAINSCTLFICN